MLASLLAVEVESCENDESSDYDNSLTISGSVTIDGKTYSNPTFNMDTSMEVEGYTYLTYNPTAQIYYTAIYPKTEMIDAGSGYNVHYYLVLEDNKPGTASLTGMIIFHKNDNLVLFLESKDVQTTIDKIDPIGGFIEATYSGTFSDNSNTPKTYTVTGKIKSKRVEEPTKK
ncbi:MAG: hypothetical protein WBJ36_09730 [Tenuifilum sp.]|uniref:hypothetical protein n=1 Tax=Tenuifilum sp. TaxID=2760880 RepID=UPI001B4301A2|nr:hypothetical protein [Bacteroidales bacterium]HOU75103.1 hypothetical protein [Tenuifilum sp.]HQE55441.1 hypothetical protein [Tenuifilum sp.]HQG73203.1 hypothetical protein [Tenuifilum sp.]HRR11602.1 hypothetical protein [Tenuifilum sp.]